MEQLVDDLLGQLIYNHMVVDYPTDHRLGCDDDHGTTAR
jgi:hypothetical protein